MTDDARIKAFLESIVRGLVSNPDEVDVRVVDGRRATAFHLHVAPSDRGQLIGKEGMTIRSIRSLLDLSARRHRRRFEVEIPG